MAFPLWQRDTTITHCFRLYTVSDYIVVIAVSNRYDACLLFIANLVETISYNLQYKSFRVAKMNERIIN